MESKVPSFQVAGVVLQRGGKFLLVQEALSHVRGLWNLPAGKVEGSATIEETAVKEAKEETGFDVELVRKIETYIGEETGNLLHAFEGRIVGGELKLPKDEILNAKWMTIEEMQRMEGQLRGGWVLGACRACKASSNQHN